MNKSELVAKMAKDAGVSKANAEKALNSFTVAVRGALKQGRKVTLVGFGTFLVSKRKARKGRNPQTGAVITIKAARVPKFKAGKSLKDAVK